MKPLYYKNISIRYHVFFRRDLWVAGLVAILVQQTAQGVQPSPLFSDHAVLQGGKPVPVWGTGAPGEKVVVRFQGATAETTADAGGQWRLKLPPLKSGDTGELVFEGTDRVVSQDVLVGDVWLCSGQSNMEWLVERSLNAEKEMAAANNPQIRHFKVTHVSVDKPADSLKGRWMVCSPATVGKFSAVGYFFATYLVEKFHQPVGLLDVSWGGSPIETWLSAEAIGSKPEISVVRERWTKYLAEEYPALKQVYDGKAAEWKKRKAEAAKTGVPFAEKPVKPPDAPGTQKALSGGFNGVVHPVIPYALKGMLWYQGEHNTATFPTEYSMLLEALIADWRTKWGEPTLPFLLVQLANYHGSKSLPTNWSVVREQQQKALEVPNTAMAVAIDIWLPDETVHPLNKREIGRRLALLALDRVYGNPTVSSGPVFKGQTIEGNKVRLKFDTGGSPLVLRTPKVPGPSFELSGKDRKLHPAQAVLVGQEVIIQSSEVADPVSVRYLWYNAPAAILFNEAGLPAAPFRTDDWPEPPPGGKSEANAPASEDPK